MTDAVGARRELGASDHCHWQCHCQWQWHWALALALVETPGFLPIVVEDSERGRSLVIQRRERGGGGEENKFNADGATGKG